MTDLHAVSAADIEENKVARKNAILYAVLTTLVNSAAPLSIALGGLVGSYLLGIDKSLATLPVTGYNVGVMAAALPAAMLMAKLGRKRGFMGGAVIGIIGMLLAVQAITMQSFWLFFAALIVIGFSGSFAQQYRFAASDRGTKDYKPKAISIVLIGGIGVAILGPQIILHFKDYLSPIPFAGAFLWAIGLMVIALFVMQFLEPGKPVKTEAEKAKGEGRPLIQIVMQPRFAVALFCGVASYSLMSYVMTAAPLAMIACGFNVDDATWGIQWHVLSMFLPSFFTGNLIARFGKETIVAAGLIILLLGAIVGLHGVELANFYASLILLGVGWNFGFIGSTAMITDTYEPHEKGKAQGANDFILFSAVAIGSLLSGLTLNTNPNGNYGWDFINWIVFPVVGAALLSLWWLKIKSAKNAEM